MNKTRIRQWVVASVIEDGQLLGNWRYLHWQDAEDHRASLATRYADGEYRVVADFFGSIECLNDKYPG